MRSTRRYVRNRSAAAAGRNLAWLHIVLAPVAYLLPIGMADAQFVQTAPATPGAAPPRSAPTPQSPPKSTQQPPSGATKPESGVQRSPTTPPMRVQPPAAAAAQPAPQAANPYVGLWVDHTGDGVVEIAACGDTPADRDRICGRIVVVKSPNDEQGRPLRDGLNEDARLRRRPICGLPVIGDLKRQPSGAYDEGWIYDPRQGKAFDVELTLKGPDRLQVVGYKGVKFLSRTFTWTRTGAITSAQRCVPPPA